MSILRYNKDCCCMYCTPKHEKKEAMKFKPSATHSPEFAESMTRQLEGGLKVLESNDLDKLRSFTQEQTKRFQAERKNLGKVDLTMLPTIALVEEAKIMNYGARKYSRGNWEKLWGEETINVCMASAMRHMLKILDGEMIDEESGGFHAAHARANLAFILEFLVKHKKMESNIK